MKWSWPEFLIKMQAVSLQLYLNTVLIQLIPYTLSYVQNMCKINNKITRTTSMTFSDVFIANFELISHIVIADFDKQMRAVVDQIKSRVSKHFTQNSTEKILPVNW